jgi:16S rRNA processing protein RimM
MKTIPIGVIVKPHGVRGALKIKSDSDFKHDRFQPGTVLLCSPHREFKTLTVKLFKEALPLDILEVEEIVNRDQADALRGVQLEIQAMQRPTLEADAYYYDQLEGLTVVCENETIGTVVSVQTYPQGPMLRLKRAEAKDVLIPFLAVYVKSVSLEDGVIDLHRWEGLW